MPWETFQDLDFKLNIALGVARSARWLGGDFGDWELEGDCFLNLGPACVSKFWPWSFPSIYSPLPDPPWFEYIFFVYPYLLDWLPWFLFSYTACTVLFYFLALAPVTHHSVYFKPHQGQWLPCSNTRACYMCHSLVMPILFLFINYMPIGPYFYSTTVLLLPSFPKPMTISSGNQEDPGEGSNLSVAKFLSALHLGRPWP